MEVRVLGKWGSFLLQEDLEVRRGLLIGKVYMSLEMLQATYDVGFFADFYLGMNSAKKWVFQVVVDDLFN